MSCHRAENFLGSGPDDGGTAALIVQAQQHPNLSGAASFLMEVMRATGSIAATTVAEVPSSVVTPSISPDGCPSGGQSTVTSALVQDKLAELPVLHQGKRFFTEAFPNSEVRTLPSGSANKRVRSLEIHAAAVASMRGFEVGVRGDSTGEDEESSADTPKPLLVNDEGDIFRPRKNATGVIETGIEQDFPEQEIIQSSDATAACAEAPKGGKTEKSTRGNRTGFKYKQVVGSRMPLLRKEKLSPRAYLNELLSSRGYPTEEVPLVKQDGAHSVPPSAIRAASYGTAVLAAVRKSDAQSLRALLSAGLSPNPCNAHGEDILHLICHRGDYGLFRAQADAGASFRVADASGATPLHKAAWAGCLEIARDILDRDPSLLRTKDVHGRTPLDFVRAADWPIWIDFLKDRSDAYWPENGKEGQGLMKEGGRGSEGSATPEPVMRPLPIELVTLVASGQVRPVEVMSMQRKPGQLGGSDIKCNSMTPRCA